MVGQIVRRGIDADWSGPFPRQEFAPGERQEFENIRAALDTPLQVASLEPFQPQVHQQPLDYQIGLLNAVAKKVRFPMLSEQTPAEEVQRFGPKIVGAVLAQPAREGRLAEIKKVDRTGREYSEFVGAKSAWMNPFSDVPKLMTHLEDVPVSDLL